MNATQLLEHFDRLLEAPGAVPRLRRFILDLAVRGKLVAQDTGDEPAVELLKRIQAEKARLVETGSVKASKPQPATEDVDPSLIPGSWRWTRLVDVGFISPRNTAPDEQVVSFVPMPMIAADYGTPNQHEVRPWREIKTGYTHFAEGDVGLAKITPCFENGKSTVFRGLTNGIGAGTTELHIVRPVLLNADYILIYLKSSQYIATGIPRMTGTAGQKRVPTEYFTHTPFPLPPLPEQHRIVAKVDELMALCDQLEAVQQEREHRRDRLAAASLQRLNQPAIDTTPEAQREHASFHLHHLPRLTTRPEHIKAIRQLLVNLAVVGKLAQPEPNDEAAEVLLKKVWAEKKSRGLLTPAKESGKGNIGLTMNNLPAGWAWTTFESFATEIATGPFGSALHQSDYIDGGIPLVNPSHMIDGRIVANPKISVTDETANGLASYRMKSGDVVMARRGEVGRAAIVTDAEAGWLCGTGSFFVSFHKEIDRQFVILLLRSDAVRRYLAGAAVGTTMVNLNHGILKRIPVALPPAAEQHRIVAKVDELMALCDQLEAQLTTTQTDSRRLLESILEAALAPA